MKSVSFNEAETIRIMGYSGELKVHTFLGSLERNPEEPQAFMPELLVPNAQIQPHFHDVDQFQVVFKGRASIGKEPLKAGSFHYADGFSPYGPIISQGAGFSFFTLRPFGSNSYWEMPGNQGLMPGHAGRNIAGLFEYDKVLKYGEVQHEVLLASEKDALRVSGVWLGAEAETKGDISDGGGQYCLVFAGELIQDGKNLPAGSLIYCSPGEAAANLKAGSSGAAVLIVQFPAPGKRLGSYPIAPEEYTENKLQL